MPIRVAILATDPISHAGVAVHLARKPDIVPTAEVPSADVIVAVADQLSSVVSMLRRSAYEAGIPVVLIIEDIEESELMSAVRCHVVAILSRRAATGDRLIQAIHVAASSGGMLPAHLQDGLLGHVRRLRRELLASRDPAAPGLTTREAAVLRLMAEGLAISEIAIELRYSERTIKNVINGVNSKFNLRNRVHAVAYAVRAGMI